MSQVDEPAIRVHVDPTNPGQYFACCGLLELADRLWAGAEGWFEHGAFCLHPLGVDVPTDRILGGLIGAIAGVPIQQVDPDDDFSSPIEITAPFALRLDWWKDNRAGGDRLKVWAGSMRSARIARAMQNALQREVFQNDALFDYGAVVYDPVERDNKVEPFYFDARRGVNAHPRDIGFSPDKLEMTNTAYPAVEFLCLVGLQRFRPLPTSARRVFDYYTWGSPLPIAVAPAAVSGSMFQIERRGFRFETSFRTDQRKHKAFTFATCIEGSTHD